MRSQRMVLLALATWLASAPLAYAQSERLETTVTVIGHAGGVRGSSSDLFLTFSGPVEVPGSGLAPGAYVFRFVTPSVVQVMNGQRSRVYGMFMVNRAERSERADHFEMTFARTRTDAPFRLVKWFASGSIDGYEPVYTRAQLAS